MTYPDYPEPEPSAGDEHVYVSLPALEEAIELLRDAETPGHIAEALGILNHLTTPSPEADLGPQIVRDNQEGLW